MSAAVNAPDWLEWLDFDNDFNFPCTDVPRARLTAGVERMLAAGWKPDLADKSLDSDIARIAAGESAENGADFGGFDGYAEVNAALDDVFNEGEGE